MFPLTAILDIGTKLIDKLIPDPEAKAKAQLELVKAIDTNKNVIVESTGTGKWYSEYFRMHKHDSALVVLLDSSTTLCKRRHKARLAEGYELPPIPSSWSLEWNDSLEWMHNKLKSIKNDCKIKATDDVAINVSKILKKLNSKE